MSASSISGSRLVVTVVENPIVNTVVIRGNKKVKNDVLLQLLQTEPRGVLTDAKLQGDVQRITDYYASQGRSEATVESIVTPLGDNRVDVVFQINEGGRTGDQPRQLRRQQCLLRFQRLASVIDSKRRSMLTLLSRKDIFNEAKLAQDQEELRRFYMSHGYADFRVISVDWEFNEANDRYTVVFTVEEGPRYRFGDVDIDSTVPGSIPIRCAASSRTKPGRVFNSSEIERTIEAMSIDLSRSGYSFVQVRPRGDRDYTNNTISITYLVDEGPRLYVERIDIVGNTKTRDYVIRREFDLAEGDPYNRVLVDRAERQAARPPILQDREHHHRAGHDAGPGDRGGAGRGRTRPVNSPSARASRPRALSRNSRSTSGTSSAAGSSFGSRSASARTSRPTISRSPTLTSWARTSRPVSMRSKSCKPRRRIVPTTSMRSAAASALACRSPTV